ncbi:MAG: DUF4259 domain-containing protein [Phycisphaeraceae bacterium]|nr:DUF4259 domain-containing protein [Phycisphaeraceae bacterium]
MGAWGAGVFENDDAMDFVFDLSESDGWKLVRKTLRECLDEGYTDAAQAACALVAAEAVAAAMGHPLKDLPPEVASWVAQHREDLPAGLEERAREAVERVLEDDESELRQLWAEENDKAWVASLDDLINRLSQ